MKAMTPDFVIDAPIVHIDASIVYSDTTPILGFWVTNFNKIFTKHDHFLFFLIISVTDGHHTFVHGSGKTSPW